MHGGYSGKFFAGGMCEEGRSGGWVGEGESREGKTRGKVR